MSSRRARASRLTEDELNNLIFKLHASLPHHSNSTSDKKTSAAKILKRTCNYIKKLQKEVDDLSDGLSQALASGDINAADADTITTFLQL
ncbi:transcription factor ILI3-like [Salvia miltiorrhiza]|uniref:transcription factor ILI3-like n=1 Tax=Salvia miltiorrhiza TaxID=226208 RepID=UPI0025AD8C33|nr:transcription factor ILI3-like [Salvia miltiorrhiza]